MIVETIAGPFDRERYERLRHAINTANSPVVTFEGQDLDMHFGTYLLQYLETRFK